MQGVRARVALAIVRLGLAALLLPTALDWRSPMLASMRPWVFACVIVVPSALVVAGIFALRRSARPMLRALDWLALLTAALALVLAVTPEIRFRVLRHQVLNADAARCKSSASSAIVIPMRFKS
jgi:hypothetical protein